MKCRIYSGLGSNIERKENNSSPVNADKEANQTKTINFLDR